METTRLQLVLSEPLPVPDTGRFVGVSGGATENIVTILLAVFVVAFAAGLVIYLISRKKGKVVIPIVALALMMSATSLGINKSFAADNYAVIEATEEVTLEGAISEATFLSGKATVTMQNVTAYGYDLYTLLTSGDGTFVPATEGNDTAIVPVSVQGALTANTWGFTLEADASADDEVWYPVRDVASLVQGYVEPTEAGSAVDVYFGVLVDRTAVADTYTMDVDFYSTVSLADTFEQAFALAGVSKYGDSGYYAMQSMTPEICASIGRPSPSLSEVPAAKLIDTRDNNTYWVAKLADGSCWMTQNLALKLENSNDWSTALTSNDTDLNVSGSGIYSAGYKVEDNVIYWNPANTYIYPEEEWTQSNTVPSSLYAGYNYVFTSGDANLDTVYTYLSSCVNAGHTAAECEHYNVGAYYNWTAAVASNDSSNYVANYTEAENSICPAGWRLPKGLVDDTYYLAAATSEMNTLLYIYGIVKNINVSTGNAEYDTGGFVKARTAPIYLTRAGDISDGVNNYGRNIGYYWANSVNNDRLAYRLVLASTFVHPAGRGNRYFGDSIRCVAR